jgi:hypothetical protein
VRANTASLSGGESSSMPAKNPLVFFQMNAAAKEVLIE